MMGIRGGDSPASRKPYRSFQQIRVRRRIGESAGWLEAARVKRGWADVLPEDAKNLGQCGFLSAREIEHGRFRALFAG